MATTLDRLQASAGVRKTDRQQLLSFLEAMLQIRFFEETIGHLSQQFLIRGATHLYLGQEAVAVGTCAALAESDYITSTHRGHGHCLAKGGSADRMMAEVMGRVDGYCRGKGGPMHIADFRLGICGANGIVGGGLPISVGVALGSVLQKKPAVTVCFFGDGAVGQGNFHESLNLAALWKLPVVFVCENNHYAMTTPFSQGSPVRRVSDRAQAYGIRGKTIDGNDVLTVYAEVKQAAEAARRGEGPALIECLTYRVSGHYAVDPRPYQPKEEIAYWQEHSDPIKRLKTFLLEENLASPEELLEVEQKAKKTLLAAAEFGEQSPKPEAEEAQTNVFAEPPAPWSKFHRKGAKDAKGTQRTAKRTPDGRELLGESFARRFALFASRLRGATKPASAGEGGFAVSASKGEEKK